MSKFKIIAISKYRLVYHVEAENAEQALSNYEFSSRGPDEITVLENHIANVEEEKEDAED